MQCFGSMYTVGSGGPINVYDYLLSENGIFFAQLRENGDFAVFSGIPTDKALNPANHVWNSDVAGPTTDGNYTGAMIAGNFQIVTGGGGGAFVWGTTNNGISGQVVSLVLKDDGNLCLYSAPMDADPLSGTIVWQTNVTDPIVSYTEIDSIVYDFANATITNSAPVAIDSLTVPNNSDEIQTSSIGKTEKTEETSGWSDSLAISVGVKTTFSTGIPVIVGGEVELSMDVTNTFERNGSVTETKELTWSSPVTVPPHSKIQVIISGTKSTINVPYTLTGTFQLQSGASAAGKTQGIYTGEDCHDVTTTYQQMDKDGNLLEEPSTISLVRTGNSTWEGSTQNSPAAQAQTAVV
jgi:hypothetical protein